MIGHVVEPGGASRTPSQARHCSRRRWRAAGCRRTCCADSGPDFCPQDVNLLTKPQRVEVFHMEVKIAATFCQRFGGDCDARSRSTPARCDRNESPERRCCQPRKVPAAQQQTTIKNLNMPTAFHRLITDVLRANRSSCGFFSFWSCLRSGQCRRPQNRYRSPIHSSRGVFPRAPHSTVHRGGGLEIISAVDSPREGDGHGDHRQAGSGDDLVGGSINQY